LSSSHDIEDAIVAAIRRVIRAVDLQSRRLLDRYELTGPQLATLRAAARLDAPSIGTLARAVSLSQPTVTGILNRLEKRRLIARERSADDRRSIAIRVTPEGSGLLERAPSLLQDQFRDELARLREWERHWLLAALQRIASMMDAETIDASPYLETGPVAASAEEPQEPESGSADGDPTPSGS